jgi:hypothetical protein
VEDVSRGIHSGIKYCVSFLYLGGWLHGSQSGYVPVVRMINGDEKRIHSSPHGKLYQNMTLNIPLLIISILSPRRALQKCLLGTD